MKVARRVRRAGRGNPPGAILAGRPGPTQQLPTTWPVVDHVLGDPDHHGLGGVHILTGGRGGQESFAAPAPDARVDQHRPVGAVGQPFQHRQPKVGRDPPQQLRPGGRRLLPGLIAVEVPVGEHQHAGDEPGDQLPGQGLFPGGDRPERGVHDAVGAALAQCDQPHLRERAGCLGGAGAAELLVVLVGGGHVQYQPVDGHHPQPAVPRPPGAGPGHRHRDPLEQQLHRGLTEPGTGLGDRTRRWYLPVVPPIPQKLQPVHQLPQHLFVRLTEEQVQRQHVIHHHVRRQQPLPLLPLPAFVDDIVHDVSMDQTGQHSDTQMIGQATRPRSGTPHTIRHTAKNIAAGDFEAHSRRRHAVLFQQCHDAVRTRLKPLT